MMKSYSEIPWTDEQVAKFWDYESKHHPEHYFTNQFGESIIHRLGHYLPRGSSVLDYGCGEGSIIPHVLACGCAVTAADFSLKSVETVNEKFRGHPFFHGAFNLQELLAKKQTFDRILVIEVIEHLDDRYLALTMENVKNLLAPGGRVIFTTPNEEDMEISRVFCPQCEHTFHRWQHMRNWSKASLSKYLSGAGFHISDCFTTDFSALFSKNKKNFLKNLGKKFLNPGFILPHLVCVVEREL